MKQLSQVLNCENNHQTKNLLNMSTSLRVDSGWQLYETELQEPSLHVGDPLIDNILNDGLRKGIIEISGEAGSGKTSLGMQLLFQCCLRIRDGGLNAKAVYLSTEGQAHQGRYNQLNNYYSAQYPDIDFGSNILMLDVRQEMSQTMSLFNLLPKQAQLNNVKLIVLDSIATFYRLKTDYIQRAKEMHKTCQHLRKLSFNHNMIVVLINQISDVFPNDVLYLQASSVGYIKSSGREIKPSLGLAWSNIINTRIMLSKQSVSTNVTEYDEDAKENYSKKSDIRVYRTLHVVFSPYISSGWTNFEINDDGIYGVDQIDPSQFLTQRQDEAAIESDLNENVKHEVFDAFNEQELNELFGSENSEQWNGNDNFCNDYDGKMNEYDMNRNGMKHNYKSTEYVSSCSPTQLLRTSSNKNFDTNNQDSDIEIL